MTLGTESGTDHVSEDGRREGGTEEERERGGVKRYEGNPEGLFLAGLDKEDGMGRFGQRHERDGMTKT